MSQHKYIYAADDPVDRVDPSGNTSIIEELFVAVESLVSGGTILPENRRFEIPSYSHHFLRNLLQISTSFFSRFATSQEPNKASRAGLGWFS